MKQGDLNIVDTMIMQGMFRVFTQLVEGSLLEKRLRCESPFTLFAPLDIAFTGLPADTLKWLLEPQNEPRLTEILCYHAVRGRLHCKQLKQIKTASTEQGQALRIDLRHTILIDSARIVFKDIAATNGIIHGIDSLLLPFAVAATAI
jgi:uncharacterized surface protein with fasciclin (FAS1) repeats